MNSVLYITCAISFLFKSNAFQPEFAEPIVNISVAVGRDATFTCHVRHLGGYRVGWVKADTKAIQAIHEHVITHNPRIGVSHSDLNTWNLHIKSITEEDRGGYMCQLNTDPMKSQVGYLDVVIPPDFVLENSSSDVITSEGISVKLICRVRGYPEPIVTWRREDGGDILLKESGGTRQYVPSFRGEVLKMPKVSRTEMGAYLCIASNGVPPSVSKRISLTVQFHPEIHVANQLVGAPFGTDVTIECNVQASPKSINYWIKDKGEMVTSSFKHVVQEVSKSMYEAKMSLTVRNFQREDVGSYRCIAKNSLGEVESSIRLYEIPGTTKKLTTPKQFETNDVFNFKSRGKGTVASPREDELYSLLEERLDVPRVATKATKSPDSGIKHAILVENVATRQPYLIPAIRGGPDGRSQSSASKGALSTSLQRTLLSFSFLFFLIFTESLSHC